MFREAFAVAIASLNSRLEAAVGFFLSNTELSPEFWTVISEFDDCVPL